MKVSVDGLRKNMTRDINQLFRVLEGVIDMGLPYDDRKELVKAFNQVAQDIGCFNCVYSEETEDFSDLGNSLTVNFFQE